MAAVQEEEDDDEMKLEKSNNLVKLPTTLASIESLTFPLVSNVLVFCILVRLCICFCSSSIVCNDQNCCCKNRFKKLF